MVFIAKLKAFKGNPFARNVRNVAKVEASNASTVKDSKPSKAVLGAKKMSHNMRKVVKSLSNIFAKSSKASRATRDAFINIEGHPNIVLIPETPQVVTKRFGRRKVLVVPASDNVGDVAELEELYNVEWVADWVAAFATTTNKPAFAPNFVQTGKIGRTLRSFVRKDNNAGGNINGKNIMLKKIKTSIAKFFANMKNKKRRVVLDQEICIDWSDSGLPGISSIPAAADHDKLKTKSSTKKNNKITFLGTSKAQTPHAPLGRVLTKLRDTMEPSSSSPKISAGRPDSMAELSAMLARLRLASVA